MKRRVAAILAVVIVLGLGIAVAVGGTGDPLVSKSYLENTYLSELSEILQQRAGKGTKATYESVVAKLDELGEADVKAAQSIADGGSAYLRSELRQGDSLKLNMGGSVLLYSGQATLNDGALADVTTGTALQPGGALNVGHRYIATSDVTLRQTQSGSLGYQGTGTLVKAGSEKDFPFTDVSESDWYYDAIAFVYDRGYFSGTGESVFSPNTSMTRAMVATVLHRLAGNETVSGSGDFADVPAGQWYSQGIAWASQKGIVNGMGGGRYEPDLAVTREQLVTMLYRYQKDYLGVDVSAKGTLAAFPDGASVSAWATDAMSWATGEKLVSGRDTGHLDPTGTATRAEVATILRRFSDLTEKS